MRILDVLNMPWAIRPEKLTEITDIYGRHLRGEKIDIKAIQAELSAAAAARKEQVDAKPYTVQNGVAVLPIDGVIAKKMNLFTWISGGVSTQLLANAFREAMADPNVSSIVLAIDSPGGTVDGTQDLARVILDARGGLKPVVTWVDGMMASAAYWIGSAADAVYIGAQTDIVGSIGVVTQHVDSSAMEEKMGIKTTEIYAGKYKRIASEYAPLTKEGKEYLQSEVDYLYSLFVENVAMHRGVSSEQVVSDMADGRIFIGQQAIDAGLVDGASTLDALMADMSAGMYRRRRMHPAGNAVMQDANGAGDVPQPQLDEKENQMDLKEFREKHPDLAKALIDEGYAAGVTAERVRIQAVEAQTLAGHDALIATLKFDGRTTGPEAAVQVLAAEKAKKVSMLAQMKADAPKPVFATPTETGNPDEGKPAKQDDANLPIEERCKQAWDRDAKVRAEFIDYESYLAFERANAAGQVRILGKAA